jgi:hypothetical protein
VITTVRAVQLLHQALLIRAEISALGDRQRVDIQDSDLLVPELYRAIDASRPDSLKPVITVAVFVSGDSAVLQELLNRWRSFHEFRSDTKPAQLRVYVIGPVDENLDAPPGVAISLVVDPSEFSFRTGIRLVPTTVVFDDDQALSMMLGLPDRSTFLRAGQLRQRPQAAEVEVRNPSVEDFVRLQPVRQLAQEGW